MGNLRSILLNNLHNILWKDKISILVKIINNLVSLHELKYCHKNLHSNNILQNQSIDELYIQNFGLSYISDFGLTGPEDKQKSNDKIYGTLPYFAPEILSGNPYSLASDIYSFGVVMAELSFGAVIYNNYNKYNYNKLNFFRYM